MQHDGDDGAGHEGQITARQTLHGQDGAVRPFGPRRPYAVVQSRLREVHR